jgi:hypothetical protein
LGLMVDEYDGAILRSEQFVVLRHIGFPLEGGVTL